MIKLRTRHEIEMKAVKIEILRFLLECDAEELRGFGIIFKAGLATLSYEELHQCLALMQRNQTNRERKHDREEIH